MSQNNDGHWVVHVYAVVRVPFKIPAAQCATPEEAVKAAEEIFFQQEGLKQIVRDDGTPMTPEDGEDIVSFMVDAPDDHEYKGSVFFCRDGKTRSPDERGRPRCDYCGKLQDERHTQYSIVEDTPEVLCIRDDNLPGRVSVTNAAEEVVAVLAKRLGNRRLEYYDTQGNRDQLLVRNGQFAGFAPCPKKG